MSKYRAAGWKRGPLMGFAVRLVANPRLWFRCAYYRWWGCHSPAYYFDFCNDCGDSDPSIPDPARFSSLDDRLSELEKRR